LNGADRLLRNLFGDHAIVKIIDFLLENNEQDHTKDEISRMVKVSRAQIHRIWPRLTELDLVVETRRIGQAKLYKVNIDSPIIKSLEDLSQNLQRNGF
jgi:predicted transcriptional regulator